MVQPGALFRMACIRNRLASATGRHRFRDDPAAAQTDPAWARACSRPAAGHARHWRRAVDQPAAGPRGRGRLRCPNRRAGCGWRAGDLPRQRATNRRHAPAPQAGGAGAACPADGRADPRHGIVRDRHRPGHRPCSHGSPGRQTHDRDAPQPRASAFRANRLSGNVVGPAGCRGWSGAPSIHWAKPDPSRDDTENRLASQMHLADAPTGAPPPRFGHSVAEPVSVSPPVPTSVCTRSVSTPFSQVPVACCPPA